MSQLTLTIDGKQVAVAEGTMLLEAAAQVGIVIPTLCHAPGLRPLTSCMLCVVEETRSGSMLPACAAAAAEGMVVETLNDEIRAARREILELLLSEHAGDCEAPCRRTCPAAMNIPLMLRHVARDDVGAAARVCLDDLVLPATLGWVCSAPCEKACRRAAHDEAIAIRDLHRQAAQVALSQGLLPLPGAPDTGKRIAVIGAGPAGLAAAWVARRHGHGCRVYEKRSAAGGALRDLPEEQLPRQVLTAEIEGVRRLGVEIECDHPIADVMPLRSSHDAVIVACDGLAPDDDGVFTAKEHRLTVRAVANGKDAAARAHAYLDGEAVPPVACDCRLGRIGPDEVRAYAAPRVVAAALDRPRCPEQPREEAERCFHCDCHKPVSCKLRQYATEYGADPNAYRGAERPSVGRVSRHGGVYYEPGKCIKCGLCVEINREAGEELGLTFVGRGFDTRVAVPFNGALEAGLRKVAHQCTEACPTGALAPYDLGDREDGDLEDHDREEREP